MALQETELSFDDIADYRLDPFTGILSPKLIGYGVNPKERRQIPTTAPYQIKLFEGPQENIPSTTNIELLDSGGSVVKTLLEVSKTDSPASGQYRVNYDSEGYGIAEFNSAESSDFVDIAYYGLGSLSQQKIYKIKLNGITTRIIASSDSDTESQNVADSVILTSEDAGARLNTIIAEINALGGGTLKLFEGTYNSKTQINILANVFLEGAGYATLIKKAADYAIMIVMAADFTGVSNLRLDNVKASYTGVSYSGIYSPFSTRKCYISNVWSLNADKWGFYKTSNLVNCYASGSNTNGFHTCNFSRGCEANNNGTSGFYGSNYLTNCNSHDNTINGFNVCNFMTSSLSYSNTGDGFNNCLHLGACYSYTNGGDGFDVCSYSSGLYSYNNTGNGFRSSVSLTSCNSFNNTADGFQDCNGAVACTSSNDVNGFDGCDAISHCRVISETGTDYNNSFANWGGSVIPSDTASGGWNGS